MYGLPAQLINEYEKEWAKKGGKKNTVAISLIESFVVTAIKALISGSPSSDLIGLIRKAIKDLGTTEQEVKAKLGKPVCPYCRVEMRVSQCDYWGYGWACDCSQEFLGNVEDC